MATASHGHMPDISASLKDNHHCAPLRDLWNIPQSKIFPSVSRTPVPATPSAVGLSPGSVVAPVAPASAVSPAQPLAAAAQPLGSTQHGAPMGASNYTQSRLWSRGGPAGVAPGVAASSVLSGVSPSPCVSPTPGAAAAPAPLLGLAAVAAAGSTTPAVATSSQRGFSRGIWGPRDDFGSKFAPCSSAKQFSVSGSGGGSTPVNGVSPVAAVSRSSFGRAGWPVNIESAVAGSVPGTVGGSVGGSVAPATAVAGPVSSVSVGTASSSAIAPIASVAPVSPALAPYLTSPLKPPAAVNGGSGHTPQSHHGQSASNGSVNGHAHANGARPQKKGGRPNTNTELYKTELCASYMSTGGNCSYGEKCQFAHGPQELKTVDRPPKWRSKPCQNWVKTGSCSYNERCCFRHDVPVCPQ